MKIKKNDQVLIIAGKDKGKKGKVLEVLASAQKVVVENINMAKKHRRPRKQNEKGQIVQVPRPLHVSDVKLICPKCGEASRTGYKLTEAEKFRICKKCGQEI
ncbi:50S ribosomal protein L24 [Patescibacteria group bacterium]|nr:50S ribosomal protein L24 [Patescibacteria group bacterium]MBU2220006.1 50S ribosomal protein L24 [Patescibacteria group bacterium]MBU2264562.1 50S ribosomal protein L24 [Patescibacteria group bacterium]